LVAHRGASYQAPESSRAAIELAIASGIDYIELDVQRTVDNKLIIFHDDNLKRLTNAEQVFPERKNYQLHNFTLAELKKLDYGSWFNEKYPERASKNYRNLEIMTLAEVVSLIKNAPAKVGLALELKNPYLYKNIEAELVEVLEQNQLQEEKDKKARVIFLSFSPLSLERLSELRPQSPRLLLTKSNFASRKRWHGWLDITAEVADGIAPKGHVSFPWYIGAAHKRGLFVLPYVINRSWQWQFLSWFSADGYITDRPGLLSKIYHRAQELEEKAAELKEDVFQD
jgi:glycerophosphoryl diester phosphodiesterase